MKLEKAITHLERKARQRVFQSDPDAYKALLLAIHGLKYIKRSRYFGEYPVNRHLPGETGYERTTLVKGAGTRYEKSRPVSVPT